MPDLGYTFTPGLANRFRAAVNGQASQLPSNATQALQILSLHLPDVIGGHAPAPDALLRGGGGMTPDAAVRAQTSGVPAQTPPIATSTPPVAASTPNASPLSVLNPISAPVDAGSYSAPPDAGGGGAAPANPFEAPLVDNGPAPSSGPGFTSFRFHGGGNDNPPPPDPGVGGGGIPRSTPDMAGLSDLMQRLFGGTGKYSGDFGGNGNLGLVQQDYQNFQ